MSCQKSTQPTEAGSTVLPGSLWQLARIDTLNGPTFSLDAADTIYLSFDDSRRLTGSSYGRCTNTYFGVYTFPGADSMWVDSLATTKIYCPQSVYNDYYMLLHKAEHYQRSAEQLTLSCDRGSIQLILRQIH